MKKENMSLAQFVSEKRTSLNLTRDELSKRCNLTIDEIKSIEEGMDLFLSSTVRQKLAKGLKVENKEIKKYETKETFSFASKSTMDKIKEEILDNQYNPNHKISCPICGNALITRVAKLYDLEDNLQLHPKARCSKCPFQLK